MSEELYDSVPRLPLGSAATDPVAPSAPAALRPASKGLTLGLLAVLLVASLVLLVAGLAMVTGQESLAVVPLVAISLGGSLLIWHVRALLAGSGRRTARISPWPWVGLVVVSAFGLTLGFSLFDLLTGVRSAARIALLVAGVVGLMAGLVAFVRDADINERAAEEAPPPPIAVVEPEPVVFFDPTGSDQLHARGTGPMPKRGSAADASLWDAPQADFEPDEPPRRARRGA